MFESTFAHWADGLYESAFGESQLDSVEAMLHLASTSAFDDNQYYGLITSVFGGVRVFGYAIITTFFLLYIIDLATKESLTVETFVKGLIQLVVVLTIAANMEEIINALLSLGEAILNTVINNVKSSSMYSSGGTGDGDNTTGAAIVQGMLDSGNGAMQILIGGIAIWICHQIVVIGTYIAGFSRLLDIGWRAALAPVGIANCFEGGANSKGVQYLKALFAAIIAGALMYVIAAIGFSIAEGILVAEGGKYTKIFEAIAVQFATVGACIGAPNKAKELIS
jgi:hypothetical protein